MITVFSDLIYRFNTISIKISARSLGLQIESKLVFLCKNIIPALLLDKIMLENIYWTFSVC